MSGTNDKPVNQYLFEPLHPRELLGALKLASEPSRKLDALLHSHDTIVIEHSALQDQIPPYTGSIEAAKGLVQRALPGSYVSNGELMMPQGAGLRLLRRRHCGGTALGLCTLLIEALIAREADAPLAKIKGK
ncbi:MAG: hypothetical protein MJH10_10465 [Epibacterium sp.]|nr:hypothetical protein [Epibacterium sp.]NQX73963.1 hypothetical protein [Epibacterium sp.]